jgi:hypothetical protein
VTTVREHHDDDARQLRVPLLMKHEALISEPLLLTVRVAALARDFHLRLQIFCQLV